MITQIQSRHFAIVDKLELALRLGMTVLTGETGAGKSILLDVLDLALGSRADSSVIRHDKKTGHIWTPHLCQAIQTPCARTECALSFS